MLQILYPLCYKFFTLYVTNYLPSMLRILYPLRYKFFTLYVTNSLPSMLKTKQCKV